MIAEMGAQGPYVIAAYAVVIPGVLALVAVSAAQARRVRRQLREVDQDG